MIALSSDILDPTQITAYQKMVEQEGGILWMRVGEGKTRPALLAADDICIDTDDKPVIVIVARRAAFYDWKNEVATLQLDMDVIEMENVLLDTVYTRRTAILISDGKVAGDLAQSLMHQLYCSKQLGCIVLDEGWLYKNPTAQKHKAVRRFAELTPTIILSGSIMTARDITDIFGQVAASGRAKVLGRTLTKFRYEFMLGVANPGGWHEWAPKRGAYEKIMARIAPFTHIYMPDVHRVQTKTSILKVPLLTQQQAYIKELKETAAIEGKFELSNMANIVTKAQQISNGWLQSQGEKGLDCFPSGKIDRLRLLVEDLIQTEFKMVIWCAFRNDLVRLMPELIKFCNVATFCGGEQFNVDLWKRDDTRICLATEASGSSVNHFAQVPYAIYFSQDFKWHSLQQSSGRHTRRSSEHTVAYNIFLHSDKPALDAQVYYTVRQSQHSERSFIQRMAVEQWVKEK